MAMKSLQNVILMMAPVYCFASVTSSQWDKLMMGELCLTVGTPYNGAPVIFDDCGVSGTAFWLNFQDLHFYNVSETFTIHQDGHQPSPENPRGLSKWCLNAVDIDSNSSLVTLWECNGSPQQNFKLSTSYDMSGPYKGAILLSNGKCLDGTHAAAGDAPTAQICNGAGEQAWNSCEYWETSSASYYHHGDNCDHPTTAAPAPAPPAGQQIQSLTSSLCIDLPGGDTYNGAVLWLWECSGDANQQWYFEDGLLRYLPDSSKCVDLLGGNSTNGNSLGLWDCNYADSQLWGFDLFSKATTNAGTIYLSSSTASDATKCVQIGGQSIGDPVAIWDCNGEQDQAWIVDVPELSTAVV